MTIDDVINAEKMVFITKVYRQGEYTRVSVLKLNSTLDFQFPLTVSFVQALTTLFCLVPLIRFQKIQKVSVTKHVSLVLTAPILSFRF